KRRGSRRRNRTRPAERPRSLASPKREQAPEPGQARRSEKAPEARLGCFSWDARLGHTLVDLIQPHGHFGSGVIGAEQAGGPGAIRALRRDQIGSHAQRHVAIPSFAGEGEELSRGPTHLTRPQRAELRV